MKPINRILGIIVAFAFLAVSARPSTHTALARVGGAPYYNSGGAGDHFALFGMPSGVGYSWHIYVTGGGYGTLHLVGPGTDLYKYVTSGSDGGGGTFSSSGDCDAIVFAWSDSGTLTESEIDVYW